MPTASGRETADEKRERQRAQAYDRMTVAIAKLDQAWITAEAEAFEADHAAAMLRLSAPGHTIESVSRPYATDVECQAVYRAVRDRGIAPRPMCARTFSMIGPDGDKPYSVRGHAVMDRS